MQPVVCSTFKELRGLYLSCNQVTMLPDEIGELKKLEMLDVRMETGDWKLDVSYNNLTTLLDEIAEVRLKMLSKTRLCVLLAESCQ